VLLLLLDGGLGMVEEDAAERDERPEIAKRGAPRKRSRLAPVSKSSTPIETKRSARGRAEAGQQGRRDEKQTSARARWVRTIAKST
jgi:hypothetical protein